MSIYKEHVTDRLPVGYDSTLPMYGLNCDRGNCDIILVTMTLGKHISPYITEYSMASPVAVRVELAIYNNNHSLYIWSMLRGEAFLL